MPLIRGVHAREVLDSRGQPTVEVEIACDDGSVVSAIVPAGASTGTAEAHELRDNDPARYDGRGVLAAVANVNGTIARAIVGFDPTEQATLDARLIELDGTPQKSALGTNAILGVSLAALHAGATVRHIPLFEHVSEIYRDARSAPRNEQIAFRMPVPMTNMISGGLHAGGNLDFQDVLVIPHGATEYRQGLEWIVRVYRRLGELLTAAGYEGRLVGDEGGFGPRLASNREALEFVVRAIEAANLRPGVDMSLALDVAATHFFDGSHYFLAATGGARLEAGELIEQLAQLVDEFPIRSIEDPLAEEDWAGWQLATAHLGSRVQLVGDDLIATQVTRLEQGIAPRWPIAFSSS